MSIESQSYSRENLEANIFADTKKELSLLKENIFDSRIEQQDELIEKKKEWFWDYLQENGIDTNEFPKASWLGKFLRTFRYYKEIKDVTTEKSIPLNYFFGLKMIEGEWDPSTINTLDWWAGISQIQPDTFTWFCSTKLKKNYKVFSDDPKYSAYDYATLMNDPSMKKQYPKEINRRPAVNKIIADVLVKIKKEWWYPALIALDDRFNPDIALEFSAEYLLYCKTYVNTKWFTDKSWDVYKNDPKFNFEWMLAFNGYNKWPASFDVGVTWNHLKNLKTRIEQYDLYSQKLTDLLKKWYTYEEVLFNIKKDEKDWQKIPEDSIPKTISPKIIDFPSFLTNSEESKSVIPELDFGFKTPEKKPEITLTFLNKSQDKLWNVYKTTLSKDINFVIDLNYIQKEFPGKELQFTDATWKKLPLEKLLNLKKWAILYVREKI